MTDVSGIVWRTTGPWGTGLPSNLTAEQGDNNLYLLQQAIEALIASPTTAVSIVSVSSSGNQLTFNMSDGSTIGPIYLPVLQFAWRGSWNPSTTYYQLDVFTVAGSGLYAAIQTGVSAATFDPAYQISGNPAYQLLFAFAPQGIVYDFGFGLPGLVSNASGLTYIYQEPMVRSVLLPAVPFTGSAHQAYMELAPTTNDQSFTVYKNDVAIGTIDVPVSAKVGTVTITADTTFAIGDRIAVGPPALTDPAATGLAVVFAAQQVMVL